MSRGTAVVATLLALAFPAAGALAAAAPAEAGPKVSLLTDPFLQKPEDRAVTVAWFTENREAGRHVVVVKILLTSDHQAMTNTPAAMEAAAQVEDRYDAVFYAGDLANQPDRGSEWFDNGVAWFPVLQGLTLQASTHGEKYRGGAIIQHAPIFTAIGNHEVQGRYDDVRGIGSGFNQPRPRAVAEQMYAEVAAKVNPSGDPDVKARWIEDHFFSTRTYEDLFTLPTSATGGEKYYATTVGDVRLITLAATRVWQNGTADADPAKRTKNSRFQESTEAVADPTKRGHGMFIFEPIKKGSAEYDWLARELESPATKKAKYTVVMMHEAPQSLGDNAIAAFTDPVKVEEKDASGKVVGIRYEYPQAKNHLLNDVQPLLEKAGVDLVYSGHSHLWNRFVSTNGTTNWLEGANTGNSYGAYHELAGQKRPAVPPATWNVADHPAQGNPGGLAPVVPNLAPLKNKDGVPTPFLADGNHNVFGVLDTATGTVTSYRYDVRTPDVAPVAMDRFTIRCRGPPMPTPEERPGGRRGRGGPLRSSVPMPWGAHLGRSACPQPHSPRRSGP